MSYNGTGTFVINTTGQPVVTGTVISSSVFNALTSDLATGLSTAITKDGQTTITNNIPFSNNKITGLGVATASGDALSYGQAATVSTLTVSGLTSGRVPYATTAGLFTDSANLTFNGTTLTAGGLSSPTLTNAGTLALSATGANVVTASTNGSERMRIDTSGNVGIGTSSPTLTLNVKSPSDYRVVLFETASTNGPSVQIKGSRIYELRSTNTGASEGGGLFFIYDKTAEASRVTVDSSGNVGIGTSSPTNISGGGDLTVAGRCLSGTTGASYPGFSFTTDAQTGMFMPSSGNLGFATANTERMRINSSGNLTCAGVYSATVGATNRDVYVDNTGLIGYVSSIRASKTEIQNLSDVSWLNQLNPVSFKYRKKDEDGNYTDETDGDIQYGMIAEDVEQVRPDLCFYDEVDGEQELRGIQYSKLVPVMLKAIQELNAKVAALEAKLNQGA